MPKSTLRPVFKVLIAVVSLMLTFAAGLVVGRKGLPLHEEKKWSIGIYTGDSPTRLFNPTTHTNPVLTAHDVTDVQADFVADPFMVKDGPTWYMFFEVMNKGTGQGDVGLATSTDTLKWDYRQIVLDEPFHLSYPQVFKSGNEYYLIPESGAAKSVRLYRASDFPTKWEFVRTLLTGASFIDSSVFQFEGRWWLFTTSNDEENKDNNLRLFYADDLLGEWTEHPLSPVVQNDREHVRPGGRVVVSNDRIVRYTQNANSGYGTQVRAVQITELTTATYKEMLLSREPIVTASGSGWNKYGMHHVDSHPVATDKWVACVDGRGPKLVFGFRK